VEGRRKWNIEAAPENLNLAAFQTVDALVEVSIPEDADVGEKNLVTITLFSVNQPEVAFSILAIVQVESVLRTSTTITPTNMVEAVVRGDAFWIDGTVLADNNEQISNMTVFIFLTKGREREGIIIGKGCSEQGNFRIGSVLPLSTEVGDYRVLFIALGTTQYGASSNESVIRVRAETRMKLAAEDEFLLGYGAISGYLIWDNETGLAAPVWFEVTPLTAQSEVWKAFNSTLEDGSFRMEPMFENPGLYEVKAMFSGDECALKSNATQLIEVKLGVPTIQILSKDIAVRGEVFNITGKVQFEDVVVFGEPITVTFDDQLMVTTETDSDGSFTHSLFIDSEERLGMHNFVLALEKRDVSEAHKIVVKSKAVLNTTASDVAGGLFLLFSVSLSDDHNQPIQGAEIVVEGYDLSSQTDRNGNLTFLLDAVRPWPGNLVLTARFEGSKLYLPVTNERAVVLEPAMSLPFFMPIVASPLAVMSFMYAKNSLSRRRNLRQKSDIETMNEGAMVEEGSSYRLQEIQQILRETQPLKIVLPDIESRFPNVWGVGDELCMRIVLDTSLSEAMRRQNVEILIDDRKVAFIGLSQEGDAELSHVFDEKGEHTVQAILPAGSGHQSWNAAIGLRVVDYEEEIVRLYNEFLGKLAGYDLHTKASMTAREVESALFGMSAFVTEPLHVVTACFEMAEYSNHPSTRRNYEAMYLSRMELEVDLGRKA